MGMNARIKALRRAGKIGAHLTGSIPVRAAVIGGANERCNFPSPASCWQFMG